MRQSVKESHPKAFIYGIMAGVIVGLGGTVLLTVENSYLGSFLFAGALFIILSLEYDLFTGQVGYFFYKERKSYTIHLLVVLLGNLVGTFLTAMLIRATRLGPHLIEIVQIKTHVKMNDSFASLFILGMFCNMFVTNAAHQFKYNPYQVGKYMAIFVSIMTFALSGYEHSIADSFFFFLGGEYNWDVLRAFLSVLLGNIVGGFIIPTIALKYDEHFRLKG